MTDLLAARSLLVRRLRRWFRRHARDLPWRRTRDPYAIWVSEVMLQQTQVATVVPYFERFLKSFPSLHDLAEADEQAVLRQWEGLGYYRRARELHRAARLVVEQHHGRIPADPAELERLPGFGRYTAGAVLSQAYDARLPILEANSRRVLARLIGYRGDPRRGPGQRLLWNAAQTLLPRRRTGEFNQAMMELGALVCTNQDPRCPACPLRDVCRAHRNGATDRIPPPQGRPPTEHVQEVAVVVRRRGRVLLVQRPGSGRWAGLWEFPHAPVHRDEPPQQAASRILRELTGIQADAGPTLITFSHGIMRYRITLRCVEAEYRSGSFACGAYAAGRWIRPGDLDAYPVSAPQRRLARLLVTSLAAKSVRQARRC
jgi:A/G-specific adenine glycosylase